MDRSEKIRSAKECRTPDDIGEELEWFEDSIADASMDLQQGQYGSITLQRKLKSKGTTYQTIVNETRRDLAIKYIQNPNLRLEEIAFLVGHSEYSRFSRAFKK